MIHLSLPSFVLNSFFYYFNFYDSYFFFFSYKSLINDKTTFVVLVDVLDDDRFLLLFFNRIGCVSYCVGFVEFLFLLFVGMSAYCTCGDFLELIPIIDDFIATSPSFFCIVEDGLPAMIVASIICVFLLIVILETAWVFTSKLPLSRH